VKKGVCLPKTPSGRRQSYQTWISSIPGAIYVRISWPSRKSSTATPVSSAHVPYRKKNCFLCI